MPKESESQVRADKTSVHRRQFLRLAPSAALASSIPIGVTLPWSSSNQVSIGEALAALWNGPEGKRPSSSQAQSSE